MIALARVALGGALGLLLGSFAACRVPNPEHCANQDAPGNQFCRELYPGAPYCSPCTRELSGCVRFEPFACEGYDPDPGEGAEEATTGTGGAAEATDTGTVAESSGAPIDTDISGDVRDRTSG